MERKISFHLFCSILSYPEKKFGQRPESCLPKVAVQVNIPYKTIWFEENEERLKASLKLAMDIFDSSENMIWNHIQSYPIDLTQEELEAILIKDHTIEIRVELAPGKYTFFAELTNLADGNTAWQKGKFSL